MVYCYYSYYVGRFRASCFLGWQIKMWCQISIQIWSQLQQLSNGDGDFLVHYVFLQFLFTLNITSWRNIPRCSIANCELGHFVGHDGSKMISTSIGSIAFWNSLIVSTINYLSYSSSCPSFGPLPFKCSCFLKITSSSALFLTIVAIAMLIKIYSYFSSP